MKIIIFIAFNLKSTNMWVVSTIVGHRIEQGENYFAFSFTRFMSVCIFADSQFFMSGHTVCCEDLDG